MREVKSNSASAPSASSRLRTSAQPKPCASTASRNASCSGRRRPFGEAADPADQQRAGLFLRVWHRSEMWHRGLPVLAPVTVRVGGRLQKPESADPEGWRRGGEWQRPRRNCATPCFVDYFGFGGLQLGRDAGGGQEGETVAKAATTCEQPDLHAIYKHSRAKRGWHPARYPCHPLISLEIYNFGARRGREFGVISAVGGAIRPVAPTVLPVARQAQRRNSSKTRGGTIPAGFPPLSASPPPGSPCLP